MIEHLTKSVEWKGERVGILEMRKQTVWYIKGFPNVRYLREKINKLETLQDILDTFAQWREQEHERLQRFSSMPRQEEVLPV